MSNQHTPEPNNLEATVFIYRHKRTGKTQAHYIDIAQMLEDDQELEHLGTVEPRMWIEHHYEAVEQRDELLAALVPLIDASTRLLCQYRNNWGENSFTFDLNNAGAKARAVIASVKGGAA